VARLHGRSRRARSIRNACGISAAPTNLLARVDEVIE
jgi:hypothetical protein